MRLLLLSILYLFAYQVSAQSVFINEFHYNDIDTLLEGVEVAGPANTDLSGWSVVFYDGEASGTVYRTENLSGTIPNESNGAGTIAITFTSDVIQDGNDGIALVDNNNMVVQFLSYGGPPILAEGGPAADQTSTDIGLAQPIPTTTSLQLCGAGAAYPDFMWVTDIDTSFGQINSCQTFNIVLPIQLKFFKLGRKKIDAHELIWETASEINAEQFILEHSSNAAEWEEVGIRKTTNAGAQGAAYSLIYSNPIEGYNYYRLKMMDTDGSYEYSPVVQAWYEIQEQHKQPPIITNRLVQLSGQHIRAVRVFDSLGRLLYQQMFDGVIAAEFLLPSTLNNSIGILQVLDGGEKFNYKFANIN